MNKVEWFLYFVDNKIFRVWVQRPATPTTLTLSVIRNPQILWICGFFVLVAVPNLSENEKDKLRQHIKGLGFCYGKTNDKVVVSPLLKRLEEIGKVKLGRNKISLM